MVRGRLILWMLLVTSRVARADPASEAKQHLDDGLRRYNTQDYDGAIAKWRAAYVLVPAADTLFAIGQAQRLKGDCTSALVSYRTVLREPNNSPDVVGEVNRVIAACEEILKTTPKRDETQQPVPEQPTPAPGTHSPWYKDPISVALLGGGALGVAVGATFFVMGRSAEADADAATDYVTFDRAARAAKRDRTIAVISGVTGMALLAGGAIRVLTRSDRVEVAPATSGTGATISVRGGF